MPRWLRRALDTRPGRFLTLLAGRYFDHDVARQGAALAYYLLFMIFPLLIFLSSLLGLLDLDIGGILQALRHVFPASVLDLLEMYLNYVTETSSRAMLWFGLVFTVYFPMRAADCLMRSVRRAYGLGRPKNLLFYMGRVLLYTVFLLIACAVTLFLATVGRRVLALLGRFLTIPEAFVSLWGKLRFPFMGIVAFGAVGLLYAASCDSKQSGRRVVPGAVCSLAAWMLISAAYSYYVEHFANYSVIYGTLGTVIILMIWLYLTAVALIMGAEVNGALNDMKREA